MYVLLGALLALTGVRSFLDQGNPRRLTTAAFWLILGVIFAFGEEIDAKVIGALVIALGALTFAKGVEVGTIVEGTDEEKEASAARLGNWLFVPAQNWRRFGSFHTPTQPNLPRYRCVDSRTKATKFAGSRGGAAGSFTPEAQAGVYEIVAIRCSPRRAAEAVMSSCRLQS